MIILNNIYLYDFQKTIGQKLTIIIILNHLNKIFNYF